MLKQLRPAIVMIALFTVLTGLAYPLAMTGLAQLAFPVQANGSLLMRNDRVIGAEMIGQSFRSERYFHGRPSAADYNAAASSGSNLGATNKGLVDAVRERAASVSRDGAGTVPVDLVTASGSGLDPHLTPEAALVQVERIAAVRGIPARELRAMVANAIEPRSLGLFGEPRVNVLRLNMMLDEMQG